MWKIYNKETDYEREKRLLESRICGGRTLNKVCAGSGGGQITRKRHTTQMQSYQGVVRESLNPQETIIREGKFAWMRSG